MYQITKILACLHKCKGMSIIPRKNGTTGAIGEIPSRRHFFLERWYFSGEGASRLSRQIARCLRRNEARAREENRERVSRRKGGL